MATEMNFNAFRDAVAKQFAFMQQRTLFRMAIEKDAMYEAYLAAFPEGTNPIFRERREHDCTACAHFIRNLGNVVAVVDNQIVTIWDIGQIPGEPVYSLVAERLAAKVRKHRLADQFFYADDSNVGKAFSFDDLLSEQGSPKRWNHFHATLDPKFVVVTKKKVKDDDESAQDSAAKRMNESRVSHDMLLRALTEFRDGDISTILDLIAADSLYKGIEYKPMLEAFRRVKAQYHTLANDRERELFVWFQSIELPKYVSRIHGSAIGTFLADLAEDKDLEAAVGAFEFKVAPENYKRSSAPVTPAMIKNAEAKINALGRMSALPRRYAKLDDITINNVLFADRSARKIMSGNVFDELALQHGVSTGRVTSQVKEVPIAQFVKEVLPRATSIEVLFESKYVPRLVSLIAPQDPTAGSLFKWDNNFSWSYNGEVTDAIKERVKRAGGAVDGDLCCRLAWDYTDDLDFHMVEPNGGRIYFGNRRHLSSNGGVLDLDANGADGHRSDPAENIVYSDRRKMREGIYRLEVNNFSRRSAGVGFEVEIEFDGQKHNFNYDKVLRSKDTVHVADIKYSKAEGFQIVNSIEGTQPSRVVWGLPTQQFHRVNVVMLSPNYWDNNADLPETAGIGHKHYFFMLDGCKNDSTARGFYNEFLRDELREHRKVFEVLGGKMKVPESDVQLSGLGFSSSVRNSVIVRVTGTINQTLRVAI